MNRYKSNATGRTYDVINESSEYSDIYSDFRIRLGSTSNNRGDIFVTPSDLALGFTKVEAPDRYITSDGHVAVKGTSLPPFISPTPSDSLVGKKFTNPWGDVTVLFADDVWVFYIFPSGTTPIARTKEMFFANFTEVTGE